MNIKLGIILFIAIPCSSWTITLYSPFCANPCQTTKGPGSYGKSPSDVRYRDGWRWKRLPCTSINNQRTGRSARKKPINS